MRTMCPASPQRGCRHRSGGWQECCGHRLVQQTAAHAMRHARIAQATISEPPPKGRHSLLCACTAAFKRMMKGVRTRWLKRTQSSAVTLKRPGSQLGGSKRRSKIHV